LFGEEQFQAQVVVQSNKRGQTYKQIAKTHEFLVLYSKSEDIELNELEKPSDALPFNDSLGPFDLWELRNRNPKFGRFNRPNLFFPIYVRPKSGLGGLDWLDVKLRIEAALRPLSDGGDAPDKQLKLVPGAVGEAAAWGMGVTPRGIKLLHRVRQEFSCVGVTPCRSSSLTPKSYPHSKPGYLL
jgi:hypothetical protein